MIVYRAVPYLVLAAAPVIVLITLLIAGCTMTRTANDPPTEVRGSIPTAMAGLAKSLQRPARGAAAITQPACPIVAGFVSARTSNRSFQI
jgi:hypothetical protein